MWNEVLIEKLTVAYRYLQVFMANDIAPGFFTHSYNEFVRTFRRNLLSPY